jgi:hypothetical protein
MRQRRHCKRFFDHKYIINLFLLKTASLQRIGKALQIFGRAEITCQRQYIGADVFISRIGEADQICRMNFSNIWGLHGIAYLKSKLDAPIYWRSYSCEELFYPALPIHPDIA